jgi:rhodanese-related sulfurtransferase
VPDGEKHRTVDDLLEEARSGLRRLEPHEAAAALEDGWLLVDIRDSGQVTADGEVPGALHVPRNALEWRAPPDSEFQDPRIRGQEDRLILLCSQGFQSSLAAATLQSLGCRGATDVVGGFEAWRAAGLPVVGPQRFRKWKNAE